MTETPPIDIRDHERRIVQSILQSYLPNTEVRAFGSRVTGKARPYSDLDLAIMTDAPLSLFQLAELREAFSESDLPWPVDLVDWASASENFRSVIRQNNHLIHP